MCLYVTMQWTSNSFNLATTMDFGGKTAKVQHYKLVLNTGKAEELFGSMKVLFIQNSSSVWEFSFKSFFLKLWQMDSP